MGDELEVTSSSSENGEGGRQKSPSPICYTEQFEKVCALYISYGMTWADFWDGPADMVKFYREADRLRMERDNYNQWAQACYLYRAMLDVSPAFRAYGKDNKPHPFMSEPIKLTFEHQRQTEEEKKQEEQKKLDQSKTAISAMMAMSDAKILKRQREAQENK